MNRFSALAPPDPASHSRPWRRAAWLLAFGVMLGMMPQAPGAAIAETVIGAETSVELSGPPEMRAESLGHGSSSNAFAGGNGKTGESSKTDAGPTDRDMPQEGADTDPRNAALPEGPMPAQPVVVELYTAQGCSSCPPADAMLADMAGRGDLLALSFHVDYWDYLGWEDEFSAPAFTHRQEAYARQFGERGLYTPQIIVGGTDTLLTPRPADLDMLISAHRARPPAIGVTVRAEGAGHSLTLTPYRNFSDQAEILLLRYLPARDGLIEEGENQGRRFSYRNIVSRIDKLADWNGKQPLRLTVSPGQGESDLTDARGAPLSSDTRHAIIVQQTGPGAILAAIRLD